MDTPDEVTSRRATCGALLVAALFLLLGACGEDPGAAETATDPGSSLVTPHLREGPATPLEPGTYQFSVLANPGVQPPEALVDVPSGFDDEASWYVVSHDQHEFLGLWTVGQVDRDACHDGGDPFDPGPSVRDLADALVAQRSTQAAAPQPVSLAGYRGLYVEVTSPRDIAGCSPSAGLWRDPGGRGIYSGGQVDLVWILDVHGQRLVVNAAYAPQSSQADVDELRSMVESLEFIASAE